MNLDNLQNVDFLNSAATDNDIKILDGQFSFKLPLEYTELLRNANGFVLNNGLTVYSSSEVFERNETFEVEEYAPGYLAIGDDSGGLSILINIENEKIYSVDQGIMDPDDMDLQSDSLEQWVLRGCSLVG